MAEREDETGTYIDTLEARVAELEAETERLDGLIRAHVRAGKAETDAARREGGETQLARVIGRLRREHVGAVLTADDISRLRDSIGPLRGYDDDAAAASEVLAAQSYQRGAEAMRERAANTCERMVIGGRAWTEGQAIAGEALLAAAAEVRALPLDDDTREAAEGGD